MKNTKNAVIDTIKSLPYIGAYFNLASKAGSIPDAIFLDKIQAFAAGMGNFVCVYTSPKHKRIEALIHQEYHSG